MSGKALAAGGFSITKEPAACALPLTSAFEPNNTRARNNVKLRDQLVYHMPLDVGQTHVSTAESEG